MNYVCEWNNNCLIDKMTRTQCQKCRFDKCLAAGMAQNPGIQSFSKSVFLRINLLGIGKVAVEKQRIIKRIREENKAARDAMQANKHKERIPSLLAINDLLSPIVRSYREIFTRARFSQVIFLLLSWQRSVIYTLFLCEKVYQWAITCW